MNPIPPNPDFLAHAWPHLNCITRLRLFLLAWFHLNRPPRILLLPILQAIIAFTLLAHLPFQPSSLIIAYLLSTCLSIILYTLLNIKPHVKI